MFNIKAAPVAAKLQRSATKAVTFVKRHALRTYITVFTALTVLMLGLAPSVQTHAQTFSFDVSPLMFTASAIFNGLFPVFAIIIGIGLGIGLLILIAGEIKSLLPRRG